MPVIKGNLKLEIDELGVEARVTVAPDSEGAEVSPETVMTLLAEKGVREGIDVDGIERAFRQLARKRSPVSFIAASGTPPKPAEPEGVVLEPMTIPENLKESAERILKNAPGPEAFLVREERVKKEKKILRKSPIPFIPARQETEIYWETKVAREKAAIDPAVLETGYARKDAVIARMRPAVSGKDGRSIYGRPIAAPRGAKAEFYFGENLSRVKAEIRAEVSGFLRSGADWCDIVAYRAGDFSVFREGAVCRFSFTPGEEAAEPPSARSVLEEAEKLGFDRSSLLPEAEIQAALREAFSSKVALKKDLSLSEDAIASVSVSPDKMRATLRLRKGMGAGRKLTLAQIGEAIRKSGIRGFDSELIKKDIQAFYDGPKRELTDYTLSLGHAPEKGADGALEWLAGFLKKDEADEILSASAENSARVEGISSLEAFPLQGVESVGRVEAGTEILRITPPGPGKPGFDVFKNGIPAIKGAEFPVRLFENLKKKKDTVEAAIEGIVEKGTRGGVTLLRVRPHKDATLEVIVSEDRMKGFLSYMPAHGMGRVMNADEVKERIEKAGIVRGVKSDALLEALASISKNMAITNHLVAEGKPPRGGGERKPIFHVRMASGRRVSMRENGKADFKNQDTLTQVSKDELIASLAVSGEAAEDGWDVTGRTIPAGSQEDAGLVAGKNVRAVEEADGGVKFYAEKSGELSCERSLLEVRVVHTVTGDVDLTTGNVKFMGKVHVRGSVISGFTVMAEDDAVIDQVVQAAFISSKGSIIVGQGIKGEGRGTLHARKEIRASFAEQAYLLSMGDTRVRSACLRCHIKCNGKLTLESEKGNLMGGKAKAKLGANLQNLGSAGGARTELSFGQDYLVKDQIEREEKEIAGLKHRILEMDAEMKRLERTGLPGKQALETARAGKLRALKELEKRSVRLLGLRDKFEEHFPSEVVIRGTMFPGSVVESHGRLFEVKEEKSKIALYFDAAQGQIREKPA